MKFLTTILTFLLFFHPIQSACLAESNLSQIIKINEIHSNPHSKDDNKEWIELFNPGDTTINLKDWIIIQEKKNFKIKNFKIPPKNHLIIYSKISLKNSPSNIQLQDSLKNKVDQINYPQIPEGKSYSHTTIKDGNSIVSEWKVTEASKNSTNPIYYKIEGIILQEVQIDTEYHFSILTKNKKIFKINFNEDKFTLNNIKNLLIQGRPITLLIKNENNKIFLEDYELKNSITPKQEKDSNIHSKEKIRWELFLLIPILFLTTILISTTKLKSAPDDSSHYKTFPQTPDD